MNRSNLNVGVDIAALVFFVLLASTGLLLVFELPPGSGGKSVWSLTRHDWGDIHFCIAMGMLGVIGVHLVLHWKWIAAKLKPLGHGNFSRARVVTGTIGLLALIGVAVAPHLSPPTAGLRDETHLVQINEHDAVKTNMQGQNQIRGNMTLHEISDAVGVPVEFLIDDLNLPAETPTTSQAGRLLRTYHKDMGDLRQAIRAYEKE